MVVLKLLSLLAAALVSFFAIRMLLMRDLQPVRVKATRQPQQMRRLRQDPRTGIYYPEA